MLGMAFGGPIGWLTAKAGGLALTALVHFPLRQKPNGVEGQHTSPAAAALDGLWLLSLRTPGHKAGTPPQQKLRLRMSGGTVTGKSTSNDGDQLSVKGEIQLGSCITGTWDAVTGDRRGHGFFQVEVDPRGKLMKGHWIRFNPGRNMNAGDCELTFEDR